MPAVARGWVNFTDLENQDNAPLWGAETTETWTTANGSDFVLIYGKPGTVALGELNDLGIGDLRFDFFRLPGDQRLHGRRHRPRRRLPQ